MFVPVVNQQQEPLMPTTPSRAKRWIKSGKATPFFKKGIFCVRLNVEPSNQETQEIAVGIDPGSKKEGFTVKSLAHTYLNIQTDAVTWVKDAVEIRRNMRKARRSRNTPCRINRQNRKRGGLSPSTKARWQWKLRICNQLKRIFPIEVFVVEDIKAKTFKNKIKWNTSFSPLEVGKNWFYTELEKLGKVELKQGYETKELRDLLGLQKIKEKTAEVFEAHCVDSWVLASSWVGGKVPDNKQLLLVTSLRLHRRQLHKLQPEKDGIRKLYGSTRSLGFKRGSLVKHPRYGITYVGGNSKNRISLHSLETGIRLCRTAKIEDCKFLTYNTERMRFIPKIN
jgi:hypothetical protein